MKTKRIKEQAILVTLILFISAGLLLGLSFFINDKDLKFILLIISAALFIAVFIARALIGRFGYKPTLEEIEERQFSDKKKN